MSLLNFHKQLSIISSTVNEAFSLLCILQVNISKHKKKIQKRSHTSTLSQVWVKKNHCICSLLSVRLSLFSHFRNNKHKIKSQAEKRNHPQNFTFHALPHLLNPFRTKWIRMGCKDSRSSGCLFLFVVLYVKKIRVFSLDRRHRRVI